MTDLPLHVAEHTRFVFLDRDGVINRKMPEGAWVTTPAEFEMLEGAAAAIATLNRRDIRVVVVTNQRGIAVGLYSEAELASIHTHMQSLLADAGARVDAIYYCPHDRESCACRKPKPGMLLQAFVDFPGADPTNSLLIGDSLSDIEAGRAVGMPTVFIHGEASTRSSGAAKALALSTYNAASLSAFVTANFG